MHISVVPSCAAALIKSVDVLFLAEPRVPPFFVLVAIRGTTTAEYKVPI